MKNRLAEWRELLRGYRAHDLVEENSGFVELRGFRMEELIAAQVTVEHALHAFIHIFTYTVRGLEGLHSRDDRETPDCHIVYKKHMDIGNF